MGIHTLQKATWMGKWCSTRHIGDHWGSTGIESFKKRNVDFTKKLGYVTSGTDLTRIRNGFSMDLPTATISHRVLQMLWPFQSVSFQNNITLFIQSTTPFFSSKLESFSFCHPQFDPQGRELEGPSICSHAGPVPWPITNHPWQQRPRAQLLLPPRPRSGVFACTGNQQWRYSTKSSGM